MDELEQLKAENKKLQTRIEEYERGVQAGQLLHSIAVNSPSNIMVLDLDAHIQFINHTVPGITPEEMIGLRLPDIVEEQFRPGILSALSRCAKSGEPDRYETSYTSPSGDFSWWDCGVGPIIQDSIVTGFVVVSTNVTELRRKHEEQERFFNLSVDLMCVGSFNGHFKRVNEAFHKTLGYSNDELLSRPFIDFIHPDDIEETQQQVALLDEGNTVIDFTNRYRTINGDYRILSWRAKTDIKRQVTYAVARDITDTKNLEEQLQQSRRLEAIGQLAGGIAHDFNNLLGAIQGNIELAQLSPRLTESSLQNAMSATTRAAALIKQLLVFSRHQALSPEVIDLIPLLENIMGLLKRLLPENIAIKLAYKDKMLKTLADKSQLEQVIVNLCVNARDAMPMGGNLTLSLEKVTLPNNLVNPAAATAGEYIKLAVADSGCGMSPEVQSHIFEPFYTTKEVGKGSGLGLATVYAIVHQHKGFLEVDSKDGIGTTLNVYLPATEESPSESTEADANVLTAKGGNETILVAEDDAMVRSTVTLMLNQAGYTVLAANDGQEAIRVFKENASKISLALLDVVMPNLGGLDAAEQLRLLDPTIKIVFTSGHLHNNQDPKRLETETLLAKPYERVTLLNCIRDLLDSN